MALPFIISTVTNLNCAVPLPCHYFVFITLQAQGHTACVNTSEGVVAPPPVCFQGLGQEIENESKK